MEATKTKKKVITTALACVLMVVLAVGGTLAYLWRVTGPETNTFTFVSGNSIGLTLTETAWDSDDAQNLVAGETVAKNPVLTNSSSAAIDEYVAMRVVFTDGAGQTLSDAQFARLSELITIEWSTDTSWKTSSGTDVGTLTNLGASQSEIYYYDATLAQNASTDALFVSVTISENATNDDLTWLADATYAYENGNYAGVSGLGGFDIVIYGAAVQAEGFDGNVTITTGVSAADAVLARSELASLFSSNS